MDGGTGLDFIPIIQYRYGVRFSVYVLLITKRTVHKMRNISQAIIKAFKWYIIMLAAVIGGSSFLMASLEGSHFGWFASLLGFGTVYILSYFWQEFRARKLFISIAVFALLTGVSVYAVDVWYVLFGLRLAMYSPYFLWGVTVGAFGVPIMSVVFYFLRD